MRNLKLTLAYDGTRLVGWQRQAEGVSVQGLLEDALARFEGAPVTVHGAGRTDAGVHALAQVASVQLTCAHDTATLVRALNAQLPDDVRVTAIDEVSPDFHARFSARSKTYRYQIRHGIAADPFERAFVWHLPERLDVDAMRAAASVLIGTHDFAAFQSAGSGVHDSVRTLTRSEISEAEGRLAYEVAGSGFLRHMVRAIVGTLVEVGRGFREIDTMSLLLQGSSRGDAGPTAPPQGLFLVRVDYHEVLCRMRD
jgi:tRNA pseudouridine38-40 synthase